ADQAGGEVDVSGQVAADRARMEHLDRHDRPADHMLVQPTPDGLDLGKLRHGVSLRSLVPRSRGSRPQSDAFPPALLASLAGARSAALLAVLISGSMA